MFIRRFLVIENENRKVDLWTWNVSDLSAMEWSIRVYLVSRVLDFYMNVEKGERFAMANENRSKQKKKKKEFGSFFVFYFP